MGRRRRGFLALFVIGSGVVLQAASGWTCASLASVDVMPNVVRPGQEVAWKGTFFIQNEPVTLRWNALDGPVLSVATPPGPDNGLHGPWRFVDGTFTVPSDVRPGTYVVIATQNAVKGSQTWGVPARGVVQVSDGSPVLGESVGPPPVERPTDLVTGESLSAGDFVLAAAGAGGVALLFAGLGVVLAAGRRSTAPEPQPVRSGPGA
ncbi:MAG TPA: hypothetical protein VHF27_07135 [Acidimicrobiales bacterium]|nr:hypothetical protein [Acidimicrobiales bacterium]